MQDPIMYTSDFYKNALGPKASIVCKSVADNGVELVTFQLRYWRAIHAEIMTHRVMSRNASSSRAEPTLAAIERMLASPEIPLYWGLAQKGMQADQRLTNKADISMARSIWTNVMQVCADAASALVGGLGLHKQNPNRILESFSAIDVIISSTSWENFFALRCHPMAEPHLRILAWRMADLMYRGPKAVPVAEGGWHLPYVSDVEKQTLSIEDQKACSVARCARVSYRNHDGSEPVLSKDLDLYQRLINSKEASEMEPGHWSPFEHQATPLPKATDRSGNFHGWKQHRSEFTREVMSFDYSKAVAAGWRDIAFECLGDAQ